MFLCSWYKLMLYYTTYIIINIKNFKKKHIKYNNSLKSIVVRRLDEQHLIENLATGTKKNN